MATKENLALATTALKKVLDMALEQHPSHETVLEATSAALEVAVAHERKLSTLSSCSTRYSSNCSSSSLSGDEKKLVQDGMQDPQRPSWCRSVVRIFR
jgi:hypothetical protein